MSELLYHLAGARGRSIKVYDDKVILAVKPGVVSFLTGNATDGEKTIYYSDCIGVQCKKSGLTIGYLQFETAGSIMNNRRSNFYNENTFTWDSSIGISNEFMEKVAEYVKSRVDYYKTMKNAPTTAISSAEELRKYKELLDEGIITAEEFDAKKKQLLGL